ncbi:cytochrome P450 [Gymnopus androsaceus JB14]|uniref:Cytochrome P450 n=1 Tax=Gymnopus androsaceus JB14 TaxID=1447944 RepID=A0A6A4HX60_9AGAR|nr:cytochrome P450 [Gymnopus androsaceus JB14]
MDPPTYFIGITIAACVYVLYKVTESSVLDNIPGPSSTSFLLGNLGELMQNQAGLTEFSWQETYGDVVKFKASFGINRFLISDPKALQHILQTSGYRWVKFQERKEFSRMTSGRGLLWADEDAHKRQRKVMLPGFGTPEAKNFLPLFLSCAASMSQRWSDIISSEKDQSHVFNIPEWASRATLDAIGQAAFDYNFGATDDHENELGKAYQNMFVNAFGSPSKTSLVMLELLQFLPLSLMEFLNDNNPSRRMAGIRKVTKVANGIAKELVSTKSEALLEGKGKKDIMSLLVKANAGENPKGQLSEDELISQMRVLILAGHETTSNTLAWLLYELVRNPELQRKLRAEIRAAEKVASLRGESELKIQDLEGMPLLGATIRETLRFHPVALHLFRTAKEDDVLPLSTPITTTHGEVLTEIPMPKGSRVVLSISAYNRNKKLFGEDAHVFNPYRWLEAGHVKKGNVSLGPFANLATFSGGNRSCIGWRFALIELQAFAVELLSNFEFSATSKTEKIRREAALAMVPTIEGEVENGAQLPLRVAFAPKGEE